MIGRFVFYANSLLGIFLCPGCALILECNSSLRGTAPGTIPALRLFRIYAWSVPFILTCPLPARQQPVCGRAVAQAAFVCWVSRRPLSWSLLRRPLAAVAQIWLGRWDSTPIGARQKNYGSSWVCLHIAAAQCRNHLAGVGGQCSLWPSVAMVGIWLGRQGSTPVGPMWR